MNKDKKGGFFDIDIKKICVHPEHNPPSHLYIPPGQGYRHVCPGCGKEIVLKPQGFTLGVLNE